MLESVSQIYGNRVRVRVCGLLTASERLLLVNHHGIKDGDWWAPPGGGLEFGEPVEAALRREFREECGLEVSVGEFCFVCEYINQPIHAVELFFQVTQIGGKLEKGRDPELGKEQAIREVRMFDSEGLESLPISSLHGVFSHCRKRGQITSLRGYFKL